MSAGTDVFRDGIGGHQCPGWMRYCGTHPRWQVVGMAARAWYIYAPRGVQHVARHGTQEEAYAEARRLAAKKEEA